MFRPGYIFVVFLLLLSATIAFGCSDSPTAPRTSEPSLHLSQIKTIEPGHTVLGFYEVTIDPVSSTASAIPQRITNWHLNALKFLEPQPGKSLISFSNIAVTGHQVDLDVTLAHPFPGLPYYVGFDVKGIVIGKGDMVDATDPSRVWAGGPKGLRVLNADGWTRWWNPNEFPNNGTIFSYVDGVRGFPASSGKYNATLCGYKVFASALDKGDPITKLLAFPVSGHPLGRATFRSSGVGTRSYKLVFPTAAIGGPEFKFNYAIDACHGFPPGYVPGNYIKIPDDFPPDANQLEPFILDVNITTNTLYLLPQGCSGGKLELKIRVSDWQALLAGTPVSKQIKQIEITSPTLFVGKRIPILISDSTLSAPWATYSISLEGLTPDSNLDQQILVSVISTEGDYQTFVSSYNGVSQLSSFYVVRIPVSPSGPINSGGFALNPFSPWPKDGGDIHNSNRTIAKGPLNPVFAWKFDGLSYDGKPIVDPDGRIYVWRRPSQGGVDIIALDPQGFVSSDLHLSSFEPGGNPMLVNCTLLWSDYAGNVIRIFPDGKIEKLFTPVPAPGPSIYGLLNIDKGGRAFVHGSSGIQAFNSTGGLLWAMHELDSGLKMFVGPSAINSQGILTIGELVIEDTSKYQFKYKGIAPVIGITLWEHNAKILNSISLGASADPTLGQIYYTISNWLVAITNDGLNRWAFEAAKNLSSTIAIASDHTVYVGEVGSGSEKYKLLAFDSLGNLKWQFPCNGPVIGGPIVDADGLVYFATRDADLFCLYPNGTLKWFINYEGKTSYLTFGQSGSILLGLSQPQFTTSLVCFKDL